MLCLANSPIAPCFEKKILDTSLFRCPVVHVQRPEFGYLPMQRIVREYPKPHRNDGTTGSDIISSLAVDDDVDDALMADTIVAVAGRPRQVSSRFCCCCHVDSSTHFGSAKERSSASGRKGCSAG